MSPLYRYPNNYLLKLVYIMLERRYRISIRPQINYVVIDSVAQLDRAFDYEAKGRRFKSCRGHHDLLTKRCLR